VFVGANIETSRGLAPEPNFRLQFGIVEKGKENQGFGASHFRKYKFELYVIVDNKYIMPDAVTAMAHSR
jgi:hypothetical protein